MEEIRNMIRTEHEFTAYQAGIGSWCIHCGITAERFLETHKLCIQIHYEKSPSGELRPVRRPMYLNGPGISGQMLG